MNEIWIGYDKYPFNNYRRYQNSAAYIPLKSI